MVMCVYIAIFFKSFLVSDTDFTLHNFFPIII